MALSSRHPSELPDILIARFLRLAYDDEYAKLSRVFRSSLRALEDLEKQPLGFSDAVRVAGQRLYESVDALWVLGKHVEETQKSQQRVSGLLGFEAGQQQPTSGGGRPGSDEHLQRIREKYPEWSRGEPTQLGDQPLWRQQLEEQLASADDRVILAEQGQDRSNADLQVAKHQTSEATAKSLALEHQIQVERSEHATVLAKCESEKLAEQQACNVTITEQREHIANLEDERTQRTVYARGLLTSMLVSTGRFLFRALPIRGLSQSGAATLSVLFDLFYFLNDQALMVGSGRELAALEGVAGMSVALLAAAPAVAALAAMWAMIKRFGRWVSGARGRAEAAKEQLPERLMEIIEDRAGSNKAKAPEEVVGRYRAVLRWINERGWTFGRVLWLLGISFAPMAMGFATDLGAISPATAESWAGPLAIAGGMETVWTITSVSVAEWSDHVVLQLYRAMKRWKGGEQKKVAVPAVSPLVFGQNRVAPWLRAPSAIEPKTFRSLYVFSRVAPWVTVL